MIEDGGCADKDETGADAYMRVAGERYRCSTSTTWNAEVIAELGRGGRQLGARRPLA